MTRFESAQSKTSEEHHGDYIPEKQDHPRFTHELMDFKVHYFSLSPSITIHISL